MKLKLKEEPKEWLKFTAVMALAVGIAATLLRFRKGIGRPAWFGVLLGLALVLGVCALRPRWFRGFYRTGMTVSFHFGQVMGKVLLTIFFLLAVTPLGLLLRLLGKDLLRLKWPGNANTYWQPAKTNTKFDQQF